MRFHVCVLVLPCLLLVTPASAVEPNRRVFGAAGAAVMGGIVGGPIGLVAGAAIGYLLTPTVMDVTEPRRRHARRRVRRAPAVAAQPTPEPYAQAQPPQSHGYYGQPPQAYGQPMYLAQQVVAVPLRLHGRHAALRRVAASRRARCGARPDNELRCGSGHPGEPSRYICGRADAANSHARRQLRRPCISAAEWHPGVGAAALTRAITPAGSASSRPG